MTYQEREKQEKTEEKRRKMKTRRLENEKENGDNRIITY